MFRKILCTSLLACCASLAYGQSTTAPVTGTTTIPSQTVTVTVPSQTVVIPSQTLTITVPATTGIVQGTATLPATTTQPPPAPAAATAMIGSSVKNSATAFTDAAGNVWSDPSGVVNKNSTPYGVSSGVQLLVMYNGTVYQQAPSDCSWWVDDGTGGWTKSTVTPVITGMPKCTPPTSSTTPPPDGGGTFGIKVVGNKFVDLQTGTNVFPFGDSASCFETGFTSRWAPCATAGVPFWTQYKNWNNKGINTIRFPLNEASWLNYTCYDAGQGLSSGRYQAASGGGFTPDPSGVYQANVKQAVSEATAAGLYVILDLHWSAPNNAKGQPLCPNGQGPFADADHSPAFWSSVATAFKDNPAVIFEQFNEPFGGNTYAGWVGNANSPGPDALTMAKGGSFSPLILQSNNDGSLSTITQSWNVGGTLGLLSTIRATGATNIVLASPIGWAGEIETWLATYTSKGNPDPLAQFGVAWHLYGYAKGNSFPLAILQAGYPIDITETYGFDSAVDGGNDTTGLPWAKQNGIGVQCWGVLNDWGGTLNLNSTPPLNPSSCPYFN